MASDFERFLGELSATMGIPSAPAPVARTPRPAATPTPAPSPSPFANASPQQQQMIQQASAGLPPDLVAQIAALAASSAQTMPTSPQPQVPQITMPRRSMAMASTQGVGPIRQFNMAEASPEESESPFAAKEGEGYYMVEYDTGTEAGVVLVAVPERFIEDLPENSEIYGSKQLIPAQKKDSIAANGQLLEQQPEEIQNALVSPKKVRDEKYPAQAEADAPQKKSTRGPMMRVQDAEGRVHLVPDSDELPEGMTLIHRADEEMPDTRLQGVSSPTVIGEKTPQQQQDMYEQNVVEVDAEGNAVSPGRGEDYVITVEEIRAIDDPEAQILADQLEASGLTEFRSDMYYDQDPESGRITAIPLDEWEAQQPDPLTTNVLRDKYNMDTEANELEAQGIFVIPDGQMAVKRNGRWSLTGARDVPTKKELRGSGIGLGDWPEGKVPVRQGNKWVLVDDPYEKVIYGTQSTPLDRSASWWDLWNFPKAVGTLGQSAIGTVFGVPLEWSEENIGNTVYKRVTEKVPDGVVYDDSSSLPSLYNPRTGEWGKGSGGTIEEWARDNPDLVADLYENGYDQDEDGLIDYIGGEAVWHYWIGEQSKTRRAIEEILNDPLNWFTLGGAGLVRLGARVLGPTTARKIASRTATGVGRTLLAPDTVVDTAIAGGAKKAWNVLPEGTRATVGEGIADKIATASGSRPVRWIARKFEHTPQAQVDIARGDVDRAQSTFIDQQPVYREGDMPASASGDMPSPDAPVGRTPGGPDSPTPGNAAPSGFPSSSVDTPPIPRDVIDTLPPAQKALYDNWEQQPLDLVGESPFAYREDGSIGTDWDFAGPRTDDEGRKIAALLDEDDYARRIIDETFISLQKKMPDRWKFFVESHDPKVRRFIQRERYIQGKSIDNKDLRGGRYDSPQRQLSQVNEARYIVDDLIPDFKAAFPDEAIPEYRYKNVSKDTVPRRSDNDQTLIEATIFGNEKTSTSARGILSERVAPDVFSIPRDPDNHLAALMPEIDSLRRRYLDRLDGRMPDPRPAPTPSRIPTDPIPEPQAPRQGGLTPAPEPTGAGLSTDVAPSPSAPRRGVGRKQGELGVPPQGEVEAIAARKKRAHARFRPVVREANKAGNMDIKDEWISAYARNEGYEDTGAMLIDGNNERRLKDLLKRDPKSAHSMFKSAFDAQAPRGVSGIEQMSPNDIRSTWGMKKSDLKKNLGVDRSLQPRSKPFDEEHVRGIVDNYVGERMDPIIVKRGSDGEIYVVAGHNRLEAAKRLNVDVPIRYTDAVGEDLLRLSRETNMQNLGMSQTNIAQSVRQMVDEGRSFEEIGRALKLAPDGSARTPATMAERYYNFSFLREGSNLHRLTDQGILPMEVSANAGRGIRNGNLTQAEVESLAFRVSDNRLNPKYFDGIIKRAIRRAEEGKSSQMGGLFDGMNVTDNLKAAEDEFMSLWSEWRRTHDEWRPLNEKKMDGSLTRQERTRLAQLEADKVRLADDLDIPENKLYMREPTAEGFLNRDYDVDGTDAPGAASAADEAPAPATEMPPFRERLYHGSPDTGLDAISALPPSRQFDNATSAWGAFFTPDRSEASRYARGSGKVYEVDVSLRNPYDMEYREFNYYQDITKNADGTPASNWGSRQKELISEAIDLKNRLAGEGHDGIVLRKRDGSIMEVAVFDDVPVSPSNTATAPSSARPQFGDTSYVDDVPEPRLDDDGNPIRGADQAMRDSGAKPLFSTRQTASPGWEPAPMNHSRNQPTAAVMVYNDPLGDIEFPNLNLGKLRDRVKKAWGDPYGDRNVTSEFLPDASDAPSRYPRSQGSEYWGDTTRAPEPEVKTIRGRVVDEGSYDHQLLTQTFDDGEQIIQRWERLANEYEGRGLTARQADVRAGDQVMADWAEQAIKNYDAKKGTDFHDKYLRAYKRITTTGKKADRPTGVAAQMLAASKAMNDSNRLATFWDETSGVLREMTLYNALSGPRYIMTQLLGNSITAAITGNWSVIGRAIREYKPSYQQMSTQSDNWVMRMMGGVGEGELTEASLRAGIKELDGMPRAVLHDGTDRHMVEWGIHGARDDIINVIRDDVTDVASDTRFSRLRLGSFEIGKRTDGVFASKTIRDMANAWDLSFRKAMYGHQLKVNNGGARIALRNRMLDTMPSSLPTSRFDELWDELPEVFGAHRIREVFGEVDAKWADRMARDWQSAIRKMDLDAREKTYKLFFSGYERNADKALRQVVFFHYWMSRATPLYTEALMRNPGYMRAYVRMLEETKEQEESGKYGPAVNGFLAVMSTPLGFMIHIRPDAYLQTVFALDDGSDFIPEGESFLGALIRKAPLMINPLLDTAINLMGFKGNTFAPDPLMIGQVTNLVTNGSNLLESQFGLGDGKPNANVYTEFLTNKVRPVTSGHFGLPQLDAVDSTQYAQRDINYFIMEVAEEQGLDPLGVEAMAAMSDPDSPLYKEAFSRYSNMKGVEHFLRWFPATSPLYPKVRMDRGDETRYIINTAEPGSSEREDAFLQRTIAQTSDPEARTLARQQWEYTRLGPDDAREAYRIYNNIIDGGLSEPVTIDGVAVNDWILMGMSKDERQKAADAWAEQSGNTENVETIRKLRREYRESHPEYNDYMQWRFQISDYEGGVIKYWGDLAKGNPNAERYLSGIENNSPDMIEMELTSVTAYMQYKGIRPTIYDPDPISTNSGQGQPYNPAATSGSGSGYGYGTGPSTTIEEDIAQYERDMAEFTAKYGNPQNMTPPMRSTMMEYARQNGDSVPSLSRKAQDYLEWAAAQPPGSDTSVSAYERWKGAGDTSEEEQGLVGPYQQADSSGINELLSILQL